MSDIKLRKWDVINHWETGEDIVGYVEVVLEDGWPPLLAAALVDVARAKDLLNTSSEAFRGHSVFEKAVLDACKRPSKEIPAEVQPVKTRPARWDVTNHGETDEHIIACLQAALRDEPPELLALFLVDIARAKGLLDADGESPGGESLLEKAVQESYRRHSRPSSIIPPEMQMP